MSLTSSHEETIIVPISGAPPLLSTNRMRGPQVVLQLLLVLIPSPHTNSSSSTIRPAT